MKKTAILMGLFLSFFWANSYTQEQLANLSEEDLASLKTQALERAQTVMMQEILNITRDIKINNSTREELIENLCSTAPMNNFTINADISDSLVLNAVVFSGSIFAFSVLQICMYFGRLRI